MNKIFVVIVFFGFGVMFSSCRIPIDLEIPASREVDFDEKEFLPFKGKGNCVVRGDFRIEDENGVALNSLAGPVFLRPATKYTTEWLERDVLGKEILVNHAKASKYYRNEFTDDEGIVEFKDLPVGEYFIVAFVGWAVPGVRGKHSGNVPVFAKVSLLEGEERFVRLNRPLDVE